MPDVALSVLLPTDTVTSVLAVAAAVIDAVTVTVVALSSSSTSSGLADSVMS